MGVVFGGVCDVFVFGCVWLCLVVFGCVSMRYCVIVCVVGCRRWVGCCVVMTVQKKIKTTSVPKKIPRENFLHYGLN